MDWLRKNLGICSFALTLMITIGTATGFIVGSIHGVENRLGERIDRIEKDVAIIKTVLLMHNMYPKELACDEKP